MNDLKYVNHNGVELEFDSFPYALQKEPVFNYEWEYDSSQSGSNKINVNQFRRNSRTESMNLVIHADTTEEYVAAMNHFFMIVEADVVAKQPGKLVLDDGSYTQCYVYASKNTHWNDGIRANVKEITFLYPHPFWITEVFKDFPAQDFPVSDGLDYSYDYNYDYTSDALGFSSLVLDHYAASEFLMNIYGPVSNPRVVIAGHPYQVNVNLGANEYLQIDSIQNTVTKISATGVRTNCYKDRSTEYSVFEKIPGGRNVVTWSGAFGFDITAYLERSEPVWR